LAFGNPLLGVDRIARHHAHPYSGGRYPYAAEIARSDLVIALPGRGSEQLGRPGHEPGDGGGLPELGIGGLRTGIFNAADVAITTALFLLIVLALGFERRKPTQNTTPT